LPLKIKNEETDTYAEIARGVGFGFGALADICMNWSIASLEFK
jgi:hypothetical protein